MKVAYLAPAPGIPIQGPTGASAHIRDLCFALKKKGVDLRVYAVSHSDHRGTHGPVLPAICTGAAHWPSWLSRFRVMREILSARRISQRLLMDIESGWAPDLIWERHTLFSDAGMRVHRKTGIPWVLEVNAPPTMERERYETLPFKRWASRWERTILNAAPHVFSVSSWLADWLQEEVGRKDAIHIPNGTVDVDGDSRRGRELLGVAKGKRILGFVGADKPWQDWHSLIPIARNLNLQLA